MHVTALVNLSDLKPRMISIRAPTHVYIIKQTQLSGQRSLLLALFSFENQANHNTITACRQVKQIKVTTQLF